MENFPCMTEKEFEILKKYIEHYKPKRCLEWGTGWSTVYLSEYDFVEEWIGVEHNQDWIDKVNENTTDKVKLFYCPRTEESPYASKQNVKEYVKNEGIHGIFDFIFIDGDYRWQCLEYSPTILSSNGLCFAHDTARKDMHPSFKHFKHHKILTPGEFNNNNDWHQGLTILWDNENFNLL